MRDIFTIADEWDTQKQIDRACAAQSPELLPETPEQKQALSEAQERVKAHKAKYKKPAQTIDYNALPPRYPRR